MAAGQVGSGECWTRVGQEDCESRLYFPYFWSLRLTLRSAWQIDILERNPDKDPEQYTDEDIEHMRKGSSRPSAFPYFASS